MYHLTRIRFLALLIAIMALTAISQATQTHLLCILQGSQETPANTSTGSGYGEFTVDDAAMTLDCEFSFYNLSSTETSVHIHTGARGVAGSVTFPFNLGASVDTLLTGLTTQQIASLIAGGMYLNIHSTNHPNGELRGQIEAVNKVAIIEAAQEVPGGDSPGYALGWFVYSATRSSLEYYIEPGIGMETPEIGAFIQGPAAMGENSTAVMDTLPMDFPKVGIWTGLTAAQSSAVGNDSAYVNIATTDNTDGEIRGQIVTGNVPPILHRIGMLAILVGAQETPANTTTGSAYATAELNTLDHTLTIAAVYTGLTPTAGHIHQGARGVAGGVVHGFPPISGGYVYDTWVNLTSQEELDIINGQMYVNLHTNNFPNGEIRGQLEAVNYFAQLDGSQEVPPVTTGSSAKAWFVMGAGDSTMEYLVEPYGGPITGETAAHIHAPAAPGTNGGVIIPLNSLVGTEPKYNIIHNITAQQAGWIMNDSAYINIHTLTHSGGEIRSWISPGNLPYPSEDLAVNEPPVRNVQPLSFSLLSAYPNPFNPTTRITVNLLRSSDVRLTVFDISGREVTELHRGILPAGTSSFTFDGARIATGVYFVQAVGANINAVRKIALVK